MSRYRCKNQLGTANMLSGDLCLQLYQMLQDSKLLGLKSELFY